MQDSAFVVVGGGLAIGLAYGATALLSGFCLLSGLRGWVAGDDGLKIRSFALALATAIAGTQLLAAAGLVEIGQSIYLQASFSAPLILAGGLLFGYGMVLSNGCGSRALVLLGRGNLRSLVVVLVLGIVAMMTLKGLLAPARLAMLQATQTTAPVNSLPALAESLGAGAGLARMLAASVVAAALVIFALANASFRQAFGQIAAGIVIGALVVAGWYLTGHLGADEFNPVPPTSLTFVAPLADTVQYAMFSTGLTAGFGVALVAGVLVGSLLASLTTGRFKLEGYSSPQHMLRSVTGAALMGAGGAMAYGCSIGQGLTGLSTLALPSFVAITGIVLGATLGLRGALRATPPVTAAEAPSAPRA